MAHASAFKYDVFLSYARVDNEPRLVGRDDSKWVDAFRVCLTKAINRKIGRNGSVSVFWDTEVLESTTQFNEKIAMAVKNSAVFVAINSPAYLHNECYCKKERELFLNELGDTPEERGAQQRVWVIHIDNVPRDEWQSAFFPNFLGKQFYDLDEDNKCRLHLLGSNAQKDQLFLNRIEDVASEVVKKLNELNTEAIASRAKSPLQANAGTSLPSVEFTTPHPSTPPPLPNRFVYLAECTPDLETDRRKIKEFLKSKDWEVLPNMQYSVESYEKDAADDINKSIAFIQLLGPYPWRYGGFDVIQHRIAKESSKPMFRHRSPDLDLTSVDDDHLPFITGDGVIPRSLEEFKTIIERGLIEISRAEQVKERQPTTSPRVFVSIRAKSGNDLWDQAFAWFSGRGVNLEQVDVGERFKDLLGVMPCHGFLLLCDESTLCDELLSNKPRLRECIAIQLESKTKPPVGIAFWSPPDPPWPHLVPCGPEKLHCINGRVPDQDVVLGGRYQHLPPANSTPTNLLTFLRAVKAVAL